MLIARASFFQVTTLLKKSRTNETIWSCRVKVNKSGLCCFRFNRAWLNVCCKRILSALMNVSSFSFSFLRPSTSWANMVFCP